MTRPRPPVRLPTLAMVDAFVGGVSILLIMTIISAFEAVQIGRIPQADVVLSCIGDEENVRLAEDERIMVGSGDALPRRLAALADPASLSLRVLIRTTAENQICGLKAQRALRTANNENEIGRLSYAAPIFLIDISYHETEDAPQ